MRSIPYHTIPIPYHTCKLNFRAENDIIIIMNKRQKILLIILDGWGVGIPDVSNPVRTVSTPAIDYIKTNFPLTALQASGIAVGLPWNERGNSEVGHLTIGAGKVLYQYYPRISIAIKNGEFFKNPALTGAFVHASQNNSCAHFLGLLSESNIHSSIDHILALLELAANYKNSRVFLHFFTDGRDSLPRSAEKLLAKIESKITTLGINARVASLTGRFYALDKDEHWDRTAKTFRMLVSGAGETAASTKEALEKTYEKNLTEEFVPPITISSGVSSSTRILENDALIFFDFREDGARQLASSFVEKDFASFPRALPSNLYIATMTQYKKDFGNPVAFPPEYVTMPLSKVISKNGMKQIKITESERYAHVTYFFNGLWEKPFPDEFRAIIPSDASYDPMKNPAYKSKEITSYILQAMEENIYDLIVANYAAPDLAGHSGNFEAAKMTAQAVDKEIGNIIKLFLAKQSPMTIIMTADHGNIEKMRNPITARTETIHDLSPVPFYCVSQKFKRQRSLEDVETFERQVTGTLADVAPTILELMRIPKPKEMTGNSILTQLR